MTAPVRLAAPVVALCVIADLTKGLDDGQGLRTCLLATRFARNLAISEDVVRTTYWVGLLRYVGCTATASDMADALGDEIAVSAAFNGVDPRRLREVLAPAAALVGRRPDQLVRLLVRAPAVIRRHEIASCEVARLLASGIGLPDDVGAALAAVFERVDGHGNPGSRAADAIPLATRITQVAQAAELLARTGPDQLPAALRRRAGTMLDAELVDAFVLEAAELTDGLDAVDVGDVLAAEPEPHAALPAEQIDGVAKTIGAVVDVKSPFLLGHSDRVARLAEAAGSALGLPARDVELLRRAGWLHDVGRAGVSSRVWDKPGRLSATEWESVRTHAYLGRRVLASVAGWEALADLVAGHHERLDGSGYHTGRRGTAGPTSDILAAADVFAALGERRPHRAALGKRERVALLRQEVAAGRLASGAVEAVLGTLGGAQRYRPVEPPPVVGAGGPVLTYRERQVMALVARGLTNRAVAGRLGISPKTVGTHLEHVYAKLGVSCRAAAVFHTAVTDLADLGIG